MGGPDNEKLVELGFLRLADHNVGIADEPLALLAAMYHFSETAWTMQHFLHEALTIHEPSARGFAFEYFAVYAIMRAFSKPRVLSDIFDFRGVPNAMWNEHVQLVAARKANGTFKFYPVDFFSVRRSICRLASAQVDALSWVQNPNGTAVCFPSKQDDPDAILLLRLPSEEILRLLVSFKHTQDDLPHSLTEESSMHISHVLQNSASRTIPSLDMNKQMQDALTRLGPSHPWDGRLSVLRVIISYPGDLHDDTVENIADHDQDGHLLATVNLEKIVTQYDDIQVILSLSRKRPALEDGYGGSQPKRPRVDSSTP
jgi:hypothetical protein